MTATERLRELLDERGVEWWCGEDERKTYWRSNGLTWEYFNDENGDAWLGFLGACESDVTPEQAIAATLGRSECHDASKVMDEHGQARFVCSECGAWIDSRMLWNPEYRNGESPWVSGCKLNFCPNCGRRIEVD